MIRTKRLSQFAPKCLLVPLLFNRQKFLTPIDTHVCQTVMLTWVSCFILHAFKVVIYLTSFNFCFAKNHSSNKQSAHCFVVVLPDVSLRCNGWSIGYGCWSVCQLQWITWIEYSNSIGIETTDVKLGFLCVPLTFSQETSLMLWKQQPAKKQ